MKYSLIRPDDGGAIHLRSWGEMATVYENGKCTYGDPSCVHTEIIKLLIEENAPLFVRRYVCQQIGAVGISTENTRQYLADVLARHSASARPPVKPPNTSDLAIVQQRLNDFEQGINLPQQYYPRELIEESLRYIEKARRYGAENDLGFACQRRVTFWFSRTFREAGLRLPTSNGKRYERSMDRPHSIHLAPRKHKRRRHHSAKWCILAQEVVIVFPVDPDSPIHIKGIRWDGAVMQLDAEVVNEVGRCPSCQGASDKVHDRYLRRPFDLPWRGRTVRLSLTVRRFRCLNPACERGTFAEDCGPDLPSFRRKDPSHPGGNEPSS